MAENAATLPRAWDCPSWESVCTEVHTARLGSGSLPVVLSIQLLVAQRMPAPPQPRSRKALAYLNSPRIEGS